MVFDEEISVANSAVGTDLLDGWEDNQVGYNRYYVAGGLVGANVVGEEVVQLKVGGKVVDVLRTQSLTLAMPPDSMLGSRTKVPANAKMQAVVLNAPTVNPTRMRVVCVP